VVRRYTKLMPINRAAQALVITRAELDARIRGGEFEKLTMVSITVPPPEPLPKSAAELFQDRCLEILDLPAAVGYFERLVLLALARHENYHTGLTCVPEARLIALTSISRRSLQRAVIQLLEWGLVERVHRRSQGQSSVYRFHLDRSATLTPHASSRGATVAPQLGDLAATLKRQSGAYNVRTDIGVTVAPQHPRRASFAMDDMKDEEPAA